MQNKQTVFVRILDFTDSVCFQFMSLLIFETKTNSEGLTAKLLKPICFYLAKNTSYKFVGFHHFT